MEYQFIIMSMIPIFYHRFNSLAPSLLMIYWDVFLRILVTIRMSFALLPLLWGIQWQQVDPHHKEPVMQSFDGVIVVSLGKLPNSWIGHEITCLDLHLSLMYDNIGWGNGNHFLSLSWPRCWILYAVTKTYLVKKSWISFTQIHSIGGRFLL